MFTVIIRLRISIERDPGILVNIKLFRIYLLKLDCIFIQSALITLFTLLLVCSERHH